MTQYGFYFDSARCTGCRTCEMACKDFKDLSETLAFRKVFDYEGGSWTEADDGTYTTDAYVYHVSAACNHCETPACMTACPAGAIMKNEDFGNVYIDQDVCGGAGACVEACPYGVPILVEEEMKAKKCDMCADRIAAGLRPICVEACPLRALDWGTLEELAERHPDTVNAIAPLADPSLTGPSLLINACPAAREFDDTEGAVSNEKEIMLEPAREIV